MNLKILVCDVYTVAGTMNRDQCEVEAALSLSDNYRASRTRLVELLKLCATQGMQGLSTKHVKKVNDDPKIFEFRGGDLRMFAFHGDGMLVAVCTEIVPKDSKKANPRAIARAITAYHEYKAAAADKSISLKGDDNEDE